jgi:hypothetical protein
VLDPADLKIDVHRPSDSTDSAEVLKERARRAAAHSD